MFFCVFKTYGKDSIVITIEQCSFDIVVAIQVDSVLFLELKGLEIPDFESPVSAYA